MDSQRHRRPIRGAFAGLFLGLGVSLMLVLYSVNVPGDLVVIGFVVLGLLMGLFGPTRGSRASQEPAGGSST